MKIKDNKETGKRGSIETMLYRIEEASTSINITVLTYISIAVLHYCLAAVSNCRVISAKKQRNKAVNHYLNNDLHPLINNYLLI
jgi:hypothetical protein